MIMKSLWKAIKNTLLAFMVIIIFGLTVLTCKTTAYVVNRGFDFETAAQWAKEDIEAFLGIEDHSYLDVKRGIESFGWTVNKYVQVLPCTDLNKGR